MKNEIEVLGSDGRIYNVSDFVAVGKTYKDATGIIFGTPIIGERLLAFNSWVGQWGKPDRVLAESNNESQVMQILCGRENTKRIVKEQTNLNELTAAKWCVNYQKDDLPWYLPSVMELAALFLVRDQVNDAMKQLGCDSDCLLPTENSDKTWIWSCSESSGNSSWLVYFSNGHFGYGSKGCRCVVRAVTALSHAFSKQHQINKKEISDEELIATLRNRGYSGELTKTLKI